MTTRSKQGHPTAKIVPDVPGSVRRRRSSTVARSKRFQGLRAHIRQAESFSSKSGAIGATAIGAFAMGALSVGALAVGFLAIHRLAIGKAHFRSLKIDMLDVRQLRVRELVNSSTTTKNSC